MDEINYLDVKVVCVNKKIVTGVYHKTDDFSFHIASLAWVLSRIPLRIGYNTFSSQIIGYGRINLVDWFLDRIKELRVHMEEQGYHMKRLVKCFNCCLGKHNKILRKYALMSSIQLSCKFMDW